MGIFSSLIGGATSVANTAATNAANKQIAADTNAANRAIAESTNATNIEMNRANNEANLNLAREQNDWNLQMWNLNNEYNSPEAQAKRMIAAGLNPAGTSNFESSPVTSAELANQNAAQAVVGNPMQAANMQAADLSSMLQATNDLQRTKVGNELTKEQTKNLRALNKKVDAMTDAQIDALKADARNKDTQAKYAEFSMQLQDYMKESQKALVDAQTNATSEQAKTFESQRDVNSSTAALNRNTIDVNNEKLQQVWAQIEQNAQQLGINMMLAKSTINLQGAQATLARNSAQLALFNGQWQQFANTCIRDLGLNINNTGDLATTAMMLQFGEMKASHVDDENATNTENGKMHSNTEGANIGFGLGANAGVGAGAGNGHGTQFGANALLNGSGNASRTTMTNSKTFKGSTQRSSGWSFENVSFRARAEKSWKEKIDNIMNSGKDNRDSSPWNY